MVIPKYKRAKPNDLRDRLLEDLAKSADKGINGLRSIIRQYLSRSLRIAITAQSPQFFLLYYLGFRLPEHQCNWLAMWKIKYLLDLSPRDHGKSWIFSYGLPLYDIYSSYARTKLQSVDATILHISKTDEQAGKFGRQIRETIDKNIYLLEDFGDVRDPNYWFKGNFRCKRKVTDTVEKDFTYENVGVLGAITGGHFRRIILDDILDDENTKTIDRLSAIDNWFWGTIWNMKETYTYYTMVGTRKNRRDLYSRILESPVWHANVEKAIIKFPMLPDPDRPGYDKQGWRYLTTAGRSILGPNELKIGEKIDDVELLTDDYKVLWEPTIKVNQDGEVAHDPVSGKPMLFGWGIKDLLLDRATQGTMYFDREKQNNISAEEGAIFQKQWFTYFDSDEIIFNSTDGYFYLDADLARGVA